MLKSVRCMLHITVVTYCLGHFEFPALVSAACVCMYVTLYITYAKCFIYQPMPYDTQFGTDEG